MGCHLSTVMQIKQPSAFTAADTLALSDIIMKQDQSLLLLLLLPRCWCRANVVCKLLFIMSCTHLGVFDHLGVANMLGAPSGKPKVPSGG